MLIAGIYQHLDHKLVLRSGSIGSRPVSGLSSVKRLGCAGFRLPIGGHLLNRRHERGRDSHRSPSKLHILIPPRRGRGSAIEGRMRWISLLLLVAAAGVGPTGLRAAENQKDAVEAARLFEDGQAMMRAGRYGAASVTFRTLLYVYPESNLAGQARDALHHSEDLEAQAPVVRSVRFQMPRGLTEEDIRACLVAREAALTVEQRYEPRDVERARVALQDLLAERGKPVAVKAAVHTIARGTPRESVEVLFTSAKK